MAKYIQQSGMTLPSEGNNKIHHFVKTFENGDKNLLDTDMNVWFLSLEAFTSSPIIQQVNFSTILSASPMPAILYISQVHYILVE
jgi:hypothetical protein